MPTVASQEPTSGTVASVRLSVGRSWAVDLDERQVVLGRSRRRRRRAARGRRPACTVTVVAQGRGLGENPAVGADDAAQAAAFAVAMDRSTVAAGTSSTTSRNAARTCGPSASRHRGTNRRSVLNGSPSSPSPSSNSSPSAPCRRLLRRAVRDLPGRSAVRPAGRSVAASRWRAWAPNRAAASDGDRQARRMPASAEASRGVIRRQWFKGRTLMPILRSRRMTEFAASSITIRQAGANLAASSRQAGTAGREARASRRARSIVQRQAIARQS